MGNSKDLVSNHIKNCTDFSSERSASTIALTRHSRKHPRYYITVLRDILGMLNEQKVSTGQLLLHDHRLKQAQLAGRTPGVYTVLT